MGKLRNKETLITNPATIVVSRPLEGWTWYCGYHNMAGSGGTKHEVQWMAGAHMHYREVDGDVCEIYIRKHRTKEEA